MTHRSFHILPLPSGLTRRLPFGLLVLLPVLAVITLLGGAGAAAHQQPAHNPSDEASERRADLHDSMRMLWEDHIVWTRLFLVGAIAGLPDTDVTAQRLLRNQADIGDAIRPFYGDAAGDRLTALLRDHILIAADLVAAAKSGDAPKLTAEQARWETNAGDIAGFLSAANPDAWPRAEMAAMMRTHLETTTAEALARLHGDWAADIAAYDAVREHILRLADMLSDGIVQQFPDRFR